MFSSRVRKVTERMQDKRKFCTAIVAAAGSSQRMGGENKLLLPLCGAPVIAWTLRALDRAETVDAIVVAAREEDILSYGEIAKTYNIQKPLFIVRGGETRLASVSLALQHAPEKTTLFAVQDGARPLVQPVTIDSAVRKAQLCGAAAPAIPVKDTVKVAENGIVRETPDRSRLYAVQTPQVFDADLLKAALAAAVKDGAAITDDCSAVERLGKEIYLTEGSDENLKITTPTDLLMAEAILNRRLTEEWS